MKYSPENQLIYYPEDIEFDEKTGNPFLKILKGQLELILWIENVNTDEEPVWIAWFDPTKEDHSEVGSKILAELLTTRKNTIALTPASSKSEAMISSACLDQKIPLITLKGSREEQEISQLVGENGQFHDYYPITSPDKAKYMGVTLNQIEDINQSVEQGKSITLIDDVYSSGATIQEMIKLLKEILGKELSSQANIEIITFAREGVIENGKKPEEVDLESPLIYKVYLPKIIGRLNFRDQVKQVNV